MSPTIAATSPRNPLQSATRALLGQEAGYTPGPYTVDQRGEHFFAVLGRNPEPSIFYQGLRLTVCTADSREEAERIALCLGAHDDMLAALKRMEEADRAFTEGREFDFSNAVLEARAAIAKAEGRS